MSNPPFGVVFHVGHMKTASSYLQQVYFLQLPGVSAHTLSNDPRFRTAVETVKWGCDRTRFALAVRMLRGIEPAAGSQVQLFSCEELIGAFLRGYATFPDLVELLRASHPEARILLVIRRQDQLAESLYKQAIHQEHFPRPEEFLNYHADDSFGAFRPGAGVNMDIRQLDFHRIIRAYQKAFGRDKVFVIPYEWMRRSPAKFFGALSAVLGVPAPAPAADVVVNSSYSARSVKWALVINRWFRTPQNPNGFIDRRLVMKLFPARNPEQKPPRLARLLQKLLSPGFLLRKADKIYRGKDKVLPEPMRLRIMEMHAESNRAIDRELQLGLGELGYYRSEAGAT